MSTGTPSDLMMQGANWLRSSAATVCLTGAAISTESGIPDFRSRGGIWDVTVDARRGSPSFGNWFGIELSAENWLQMFVPRGFLHGFLTLQPDTEVQYKVDNAYAPECDGAVRWDDPDLAIGWPLAGAPKLSDKDAAAPLFAEWDTPFAMGDSA